METIPCNHCGSTDSAPFLVVTDLLLDRKEVQTILVRCRNCGLAYQNPRPTIEEMAAHYPREYDSYDADPGARNATPLMRRMIQFGIQKRLRTITRIKKKGHLLDIGCATGSFLLGMRTQPGWELSGVEINPHAAEIARSYGLDVLTGTLDSAAFSPASFDAVTLWDVFEHLHDPTAALLEVHRILRSEGVLAMRVPNLDSWDARVFGPYWAGLDSPRHTYIFDLMSLQNMLTRAGFTDISMKCNIGGYPTFVLSLRFWLTAKGIKPEKRARIVKLFLHPLARILTAPYFYLASLGLRGSQVTLTAIKRV